MWLEQMRQWFPGVRRRTRPQMPQWRASARAAGWLALTCFCAARGFAQEPRMAVSLNHGWRFRQSAAVTGAENPAFDDSSWSTIDVPHTWNRLGNQGTTRSPLTNAVQGIGWYRLRFRTPPATRGTHRYFLQFDAVGAIADVWLNGRYLGKHAGAFSRFRFDATPAIHPSGENILVVRADNSRPEPGSSTAAVIPLSGDFFVFGGIYRSVTLIVTQPAHVDLLDYGGPGVYARVDSILPAAARVKVWSRVVNDGARPVDVSVETAIEDADGRTVASVSSPSIALTGKVMVVPAALSVTHPRLWQGMKDPYLYRTVVTLRSARGRILDRVTQPLGLRKLAFDPNKGFFLNGKHLFLRGVSLHQDRPLEGWAISNADQDQDFDYLIDMGANAVRLAHYQHDQHSYEIADRRGIVVWAEIPLVNQVSFDGTPASKALAANATQQLLELIHQNYNHPSIAVWSIANEVDLRATQSKGPSKPLSLLQSLQLLATSADPSRFTTLADCCEMGLPPHAGEAGAGFAPRDQIVGVTDLVGYNRYFGWYDGKFSDFGAMLDAAHARHSSLPIAVSEYGAGAALTQHSDDPTGGPINPHGRPHPEEYQDLYHEASWATLKLRSYLWGVFIWNMFDFASPTRNEGDQTDINDKGLVSYDRSVVKDAYYFYRANWSPKPTLHLVGRRYTDRAYAVLNVKAYSNATEARLFINGHEQRVTPCSKGICLWRGVHLAQGVNEVRATAEIGGARVSDTMKWSFSGSPAIVRIKAGDISGYVANDKERYGSDMYFVGGEGKGIDPPDTPAAKRTTVSASDPRLYDSYREGEFSYRIPVPGGRYRVTLRFVEPKANAVGERVFDVEANGKSVLKGFDAFAAAGGKLKSVERAFEAAVTDGTLLIAFRPSRGSAVVSSLVVTPLKAPGTS